MNIRLSVHAMHYSYARDSAIGLPKAKPPGSVCVCVWSHPEIYRRDGDTPQGLKAKASRWLSRERSCNASHAHLNECSCVRGPYPI